MKKAWNEVKSFVTIVMTIGYIILTIMDKMTPEYQNIFLMIIAFYFGTQAEKLNKKIGSDKNE